MRSTMTDARRHLRRPPACPSSPGRWPMSGAPRSRARRGRAARRPGADRGRPARDTPRRRGREARPHGAAAIRGRAPDRASPPTSTRQLVLLTKRAALMESQVDVLEGKRRALGRYREALATYVEALAAFGDGRGADARSPAPGRSPTRPVSPPAVSRLLLGAQEDLRREIARAMHDGPAQSLTNIVLQAQIVERLVDQDPGSAGAEVRQLVAMVQQTLEATKTFIFDVRPMVLDDLGLVPTLRRATRERGRRAGIPVDFESLGADRRLPMDLESGLFRILDEALAAYLSARAERVVVPPRLVGSGRGLGLGVAGLGRRSGGRRPTRATSRHRPAAGPRGDDGGPARRRARCRRGGQARGDRRPAAIDLARDPGPRRDARRGRRAVGRGRQTLRLVVERRAGRCRRRCRG